MLNCRLRERVKGIFNNKEDFVFIEYLKIIGPATGAMINSGPGDDYWGSL